MPDASNRQASIDSRRIALEREIAIRVPAFDDFVTEYSANISTTGMFIVSEKPQPPGTGFTFEFSVADDWKLIRGKGQVVWTRYRDEGKERPAGMGIRFTELDAQSRRLIRWIVEKHIREGGKPFELDDLRSAVDDALSEALDPKARPAPVLKRRKARRRSPPDIRPLRVERRWAPLLISALAVIALLAALFWLSERTGRMVGASTAEKEEGGAAVAEAWPSEERAGEGEKDREAAPAAQRPGGAAPTAAQPGAAAAQPGSPAPGIEAPAPALERVEAVVQAWSSAWSDQDVETYLSHYSREFKPGGGISRGDWAAQRRERVSTPRFIRVVVAGLEAERVGEGRARATFVQTYRSDRFGDEVRKVLELVWEEGAWKILEEKTLS